MNNRGRVLAMTVGSFLAFLIFGVIDAMKGPTLSAVLEEMQYSYSRGGLIVMAAYFGFVVATLVDGVIADLVNKKSLIIIAAVAYLAGIAAYASASSLPLFLAGYFLIGFGCGTVELGSNYIIIDVQKRPGLYLNVLASFFGLGSMLAPVYAGRMFKAGFTWREIYLLILIAPLLLLVFFLVARYPKTEGSQPAALDFRHLMRTAFTGLMWWFYLLVFAYVAAEVIIGAWLVEYLKGVDGMPIDQGSWWLALYFAGIMVGRFVGGFLVEHIGYVRSMAGAVVLSIVCVAVGVYGPASLSFLLPATGLFYAVILPTAIAYVSTLGQRNMGAILGLLFCFVGFGGMAGPWLTGIVNDTFGLRAGMAMAGVFGLVMLASLAFIRAAARKHAPDTR